VIIERGEIEDGEMGKSHAGRAHADVIRFCHMILLLYLMHTQQVAQNSMGERHHNAITQSPNHQLCSILLSRAGFIRIEHFQLYLAHQINQYKARA
jgi:hypothetical protein